MRVGICAFWFNRGQGVVARQLRSALDQLGHETFILGRPTKESFPMPQETRERRRLGGRGGHLGVELLHPRRRAGRVGASETGIEACFFDQNYEFEAVARAARIRRPHDRAVRLGALQRRARRADQARVRPRLLADPRRTGALRDDGDRDPLRPVRRPPRVLRDHPAPRTPGRTGREAEDPPELSLPLPRRTAGQAEALQGGHQRLLRHERSPS